jgi:xanthine dehydrogenase YagS FAD-binding subunit
MRPFTYVCPKTVDDALRAHGTGPDVQFIGGGTNLLDLMKMGVERPAHIVDVNKLPLKTIEEHNGGIRIGALVSNTDAANHRLIRSRYPVLSQAILAGASPQLRNKATMGGNLLQRTRCYYFYDPSFRECNKRTPGSGCAAREGYNRIHAILGASDECIAVHPSDMCVALSALDAVVQVMGPKGERSIPMRDFHRLPGTTPQRDTNLQPGELITAIDLPAIPYGRRSTYIKVRDRNSYAFALVSIATVLDADESGHIRKVHIALGGVAHKPWRATKAEALLAGKNADETTLRAAADAELQSAHGYRDNAFKIQLAKRCIVRGVLSALSAA